MTTRESPSPSSSSSAQSPGRVLLVDDHHQVRRMLSVAFDLAGFTVLEAATQLEAQWHLARTRPDALVLNLQRAATDGLDLLTLVRARQTLYDVPLVFLAGLGNEDCRWQALSSGADWFAVRPICTSELKTHIKEFIRDGRPSAQARRQALPPTPISRLKPTG
jgi:DNA-binding response OmpR family regulator